ncbi:MAG: glycosyltransferase family 39 protein [Planctomycetaceae bacterium]|nr:glycosyltransferase family 39 protein [Planctomycetaceae bacterium]
MKPNRIVLLLILLTAFALRIGAAVYWQERVVASNYVFFFGDSDTYWQLAASLAHGQAYQYGDAGEFRIFRMPGYPLILVPLFWLFELSGQIPPVFSARIVSVLFGVATVFAVTLPTRQLFDDKRIANVAAAFVAFAPLQIVSSVLVLSEAPFGFFMLLQIDCWLRTIRTGKRRYAILLGVLTAVCVFIRPGWLLFLPFAAVLHLLVTTFADKRCNLRLVTNYAMVTLVFVVAMSAWWIRNYEITGRFVPTTLQTGASLYDGWRPDADGSSDMRFVEEFRKKFPVQSPTYEYDVDDSMKAAAMELAKENPTRIAKLAVTKFVRIWNIIPNEPSFSKPAVRLILAITYLPIIIAAFVGTFRLKIPFATTTILWLPAIYITLLHTIFVASIRYRTPAMLCLAILAAGMFCGKCSRNHK